MGKPRIKVLCLHGMGVNGDVFAMQTGKDVNAFT